MTNQLAIYENFDTLTRAAMALQKSGFFTDVKSEAQAIVKVMAGAELGLPPFASMTGIHIIQGKPVLGANVIATLVKNDPRYNYLVKTCTDSECILTWLENGQEVGTSGFTMTEAKTAGLTGKDNWRKWPSDMLFARAISRGARRFAPGIFGGSPVYTPDEMDVDVDEDGAILAEVRDVTHEPAPRSEAVVTAELGFEPERKPAPKQNGNGKSASKSKAELTRPYPPEVLKERLTARAEMWVKEGITITPNDRAVLAKALTTMFDGDNTKRYEFTKWLSGGESSTKKLGAGLVKAMLADWLKVASFNDAPAPDAMSEARTAHAEALKASGQAELNIAG